MASSDVISTIPNEIKNLIIENLSDHDLANFRRTKRSIELDTFQEWRKRCGQDKDGVPALVWAAGFGKKGLLIFLLAQFPEVDVNTTQGEINMYEHNPLTAASYHGHIEEVEILLDHGIRVDYQITSGSPILHKLSALLFAASTSHDKVVQLLLENHSNPNLTRYWDGSNILHVACLHNRIGTLKTILNWKQKTSSAFPDLEGDDNFGETPLEFVLDIHFQNLSTFTTPLWFELEGFSSHLRLSGHNSQYKTFLQPWKIGELSLKDRIAKLSESDLKNLNQSLQLKLPDGPDYGEKIFEIFEEPIQLQIKRPSLELGQALIDGGARAAVKENHSAFIVHPSDAMENGDTEMLYFLNSSGLGKIDSLKESSGLSALHVLVGQEYAFPHSFLAVMLLEAMGANMFLDDWTGTSPEQMAKESGWPKEIIQMFLNPAAIEIE